MPGVVVAVASYLVKILVEVVASSSYLVAVASCVVVVAYLDVQEEEALACCTAPWVVSWACLLLLLAIGEEAAFPSSWACLSLVAVAADILVVVVVVDSVEAAVAADADGALPINFLPAAEMILMTQAALHSTELVSFAQQEAKLADH